MVCNSNYGGSAGQFLRRLNIGTHVVVQFDGGGNLGLLTATFQGFDSQGLALFANATLAGVTLPGLTRLSINSINSVSV